MQGQGETGLMRYVAFADVDAVVTVCAARCHEMCTESRFASNSECHRTCITAGVRDAIVHLP
jgi:hypothetical protein